MTTKKNICSFLLIILLAVSLSGVQAVGNREEQPASRFKKAVRLLLHHKTAIALPIVAFVAYSVIQGDIPFIDLPQGFLEYFDLASWSNYFTGSGEIILDSSFVVDTSTSLILNQAGQIKSLLETISSAELKEIIDAIPESILERVPEAAVIAEKIAQNINSVSEYEISSLVESIKTCMATMKASGQTLSRHEYLPLIRIYLRHFELIEKLEAIVQ